MSIKAGNSKGGISGPGHEISSSGMDGFMFGLGLLGGNG